MIKELNVMMIIGLFIAALSLLLLSCNKTVVPPELLKMFEDRQIAHKGLGFTMPYRLFIPEGYDAATQYPLVLYLHGGTARGRDNKKQLLDLGTKTFSTRELQKKYPAFIVAPQCPKREEWLNHNASLPFQNYSQDTIPESRAMKTVILLLEQLTEEFSINTRRLYVTGSSMGGSGTWDIITRYPDLFAAAVPITGVSDPTKAGLVKELPIWAFHGELDNISTVQNTRNMVEAIKKAGGEKVKFTEYKKGKHDSWVKAYSDEELFSWMFDQKRE